MCAFSSQDLLPISALQHLSFCERQWAIIHLEQTWVENSLTFDGQLLHTRVDSGERENRRKIRIARGLRINSFELGLTGCADIVEFHRGDWLACESITFGDSSERWRPTPVEYKRGKKKLDECDEVQLCAQAICLEEMLKVRVHLGFIYYGKTRRRISVEFSDALRNSTEKLSRRLHELTKIGLTPPPIPGAYCASCSLNERCLPEVMTKRKSARRYIDRFMTSEIGE